MKNRVCFKKFRVWEVVVPVRADIIQAPSGYQAVWPNASIHLIEGETSAGWTAIGESSRGESSEVVGKTLRSLLELNLLEISPATAWMEEGDPIKRLTTFWPEWSWQMQKGMSYLLFESLWLDAVGKWSNLPASTLLGGAVRKQVDVDFWVNRPNASSLRGLIEEAHSLGCQGLKLKGLPTGFTVDVVEAVAPDMPPKFRLTIDAVNSWRNFAYSQSWLARLSELPCNIQLEDPYLRDVPHEWRRAQERYPLTLIWHVQNDTQLRTAIMEGAADAFNVGYNGAFASCKAASAIEVHQRDCWFGGAMELGVLQHLRLHAATTTRASLLGNDFQSEWVREHTLISPRMKIVNGQAYAPDGPGLGVALDHQAIAHFCQREFEIS